MPKHEAGICSFGRTADNRELYERTTWIIDGTMKRLVFIIALTLLLAGGGFIGTLNMMAYSLYVVFVLVNLIIIQNLLRTDDLRLNLPYLYLFIVWLLFNSLGFCHSAIADKRFEGKYIIEVYFIFIFSTILLYIPIYNKIRKRNATIISVKKTIFNIRPKAVLLIMITGISLQFYKLYSAGGLMAYIFTRYGEKTESSMATFFHLFGGILNGLNAFILPYVCMKGNGFFRAVAIFYFVFNIFMAAAGGASLALVSPLISVFVFTYFIHNDLKKRRKLKIVSSALLGLAVFGGMAIRINRKNVDNFEFGNITEIAEDIMVSRTFDNVTNLNTIIENFSPVYTPEQFILPYVHMLPRSIFPWKPMELGRIVGMNYVGTSEESMAGFITSPMGDFYYDFGILGIVFGMLFCGIVFATITEKLNQYKLTPFILSLTMSISGAFFGFYGWYTGCFNGLVNLAIGLVIIFFLNKLFNPKYV